jgi:RNA polymerase sigma factor (sigma-70 family)
MMGKLRRPERHLPGFHRRLVMRTDPLQSSTRPETPRAVPLKVASDELLVAQVRAGSERAFEALFERHRRGVLALCRGMLGSTADAEDALQYTFLAAYRDLTRSQKPIVLRPWLYMIARHRCVSLVRARRERPVDELPDAPVDRLTAEVATREDLRTTVADIGRLPSDQRAALILVEFWDVPRDEIARILGCHRDKVRALVFQARRSLRADRAARETPCAEIREQLVTLGGALRNRHLRRHVRVCEGCRAFRQEVRIHRGPVRVLVPVVPALALKRVSSARCRGGPASAREAPE